MRPNEWMETELGLGLHRLTPINNKNASWCVSNKAWVTWTWTWTWVRHELCFWLTSLSWDCVGVCVWVVENFLVLNFHIFSKICYGRQFSGTEFSKQPFPSPIRFLHQKILIWYQIWKPVPNFHIFSKLCYGRQFSGTKFVEPPFPSPIRFLHQKVSSCYHFQKPVPNFRFRLPTPFALSHTILFSYTSSLTHPFNQLPFRKPSLLPLGTR